MKDKDGKFLGDFYVIENPNKPGEYFMPPVRETIGIAVGNVAGIRALNFNTRRKPNAKKKPR